MRRELSFTSGGVRCAARLYEPAASGAGGSRPLVVLGNGFSLTQDDGVPAYAEAFVAAGVAALSFDYRHFGDSGGEPRQRFRSHSQREDWLAALDYAPTLEGIDPRRIVPWGYSFGAGHLTALLAAREIDPPAAIMVAPFVDGLRRVAAADPAQVARLLPQVLLDVIGVGRTIPVTGAPDLAAAMNFPGEAEGFEAGIPEGSAWRNEVSAGVFATVALHRPWKRARRIPAPLWVALGDDDITTDAEAVRGLALRARRGELHRYPLDHFGFLFPDRAEQIAADQIAFLERVGLLD